MPLVTIAALLDALAETPLPGLSFHSREIYATALRGVLRPWLPLQCGSLANDRLLPSVLARLRLLAPAQATQVRCGWRHLIVVAKQRVGLDIVELPRQSRRPRVPVDLPEEVIRAIQGLLDGAPGLKLAHLLHRAWTDCSWRPGTTRTCEGLIVRPGLTVPLPAVLYPHLLALYTHAAGGEDRELTDPQVSIVVVAPGAQIPPNSGVVRALLRTVGRQPVVQQQDAAAAVVSDPATTVG